MLEDLGQDLALLRAHAAARPVSTLRVSSAARATRPHGAARARPATPATWAARRRADVRRAHVAAVAARRGQPRHPQQGCLSNRPWPQTHHHVWLPHREGHAIRRPGHDSVRAGVAHQVEALIEKRRHLAKRACACACAASGSAAGAAPQRGAARCTRVGDARSCWSGKSLQARPQAPALRLAPRAT